MLLSNFWWAAGEKDQGMHGSSDIILNSNLVNFGKILSSEIDNFEVCPSKEKLAWNTTPGEKIDCSSTYSRILKLPGKTYKLL